MLSAPRRFTTYTRPLKKRAIASLWTPPSLMSLKTLREARSTTEYEPVEASVVSTTATLVMSRGLAGADTRASPLAVPSRSVLSLLLL